MIEIVNDDMPFLLDSVMGELAERGVEARLVAHPVFTVTRDPSGRLTGFEGLSPPGEGGSRESFIHIHLDRIAEEAQRAELLAALEIVLADVRLGVHDWRAMMARVGEIAAELKVNPPPLPKEEIEEAVAFLEWLADNNFTFLGARDYVLRQGRTRCVPMHETGLGLLRSPDRRVLRTGTQLVAGHAGAARLPDGAEAPDRHQVGGALEACTGARTWTTSASSASMPPASSSANSASSACSRRRSTRARPAPSPICAARSTP